MIDQPRLTTFTNGNPVAVAASGSASSNVSICGSVSPVSISVNNTGNFTFAGSGNLAGSASLVKSGSGTLALNTANSFTGGVTINSGIVILGNAAALGAGAVTLSGGR
jgi:autotransporter-associated beta strand protein